MANVVQLVVRCYYLSSTVIDNDNLYCTAVLVYSDANKYFHTSPRTRKHEIFNNVYFINNTSIFNNLIKELFEVASFRLHTGLQTLCQRLDGEPQIVDVEFAPCLGQGLLQKLQTLVAPSRHLLLQNAPH